MSETPETRPRGRPTDYRDEYVQMMLDYFNPEAPGAIMPLMSGFAWKLGVTRSTLHLWATATDEAGNLKHPDFSDVYERCRGAQEMVLTEGMLSGRMQNASYAALLAKNTFGWRDKQDLEHSGPGGSAMVFKISQDEADL